MGNGTASRKPRNPAAIHIVELLNRHWLSKSAFEIELSRPRSFEFTAGQTIRLIDKSFKRYYSLISAPIDPSFKLCVQHVPEGKFSSILASAEIGSQLQMTGPHGYFIFKPSIRTPVFISTGTGVAPFVCFARSGITGFALFQQAMTADELYYRDYLKKCAQKYFPCLPDALAVTSAEDPFCLDLLYGKITECIEKTLRRGKYDFYLCGEQEMIRDVTLLVDEIYPESRIYTEAFY
jgi:benzoate/toluate 1,2-dioxygenase reductase subunit